MPGAHFLGQLSLGHAFFQTLADDGLDDVKFGAEPIVLRLEFRIFEGFGQNFLVWYRLKFIHTHLISYMLYCCQEVNSVYGCFYVSGGCFLRFFNEDVDDYRSILMKTIEQADFLAAADS